MNDYDSWLAKLARLRIDTATKRGFADLQAIPGQVKQLLDAEFHPGGYNVGANCGEAAGVSVELTFCRW